MKLNVWAIKISLLLSLVILAGSSYAAEKLFNTSFTKNGNSGDGFIVVSTNIPNHTYSSAGIKLKGSNYILSNSSDCTVNPLNGWCMFSASNQSSHAFEVTKVKNVDAKLNAVQFSLALNARNQPISTQDTTLITNNQLSVTSGKMIGYLTGWETPPDVADIASKGYTHVLISFGLFSTLTPGDINIQSINEAPYGVFTDLKGYIDGLHEYGIQVLLSIGGAATDIPDATVDFDSAVSQATSPADFEAAFTASMQTLMTTYGFDGFDFDIESGLYAANSFTEPDSGCEDKTTYAQACDISYLASIINSFKADNPNVLITLAPQITNIAATATFDNINGNYSSLIMQTCSSLAWVGFQNYNSGCQFGIDGICYPNPDVPSSTLSNSPDSAVAFAVDLLEDWPQGTERVFLNYTSCLGPSQVVIGYCLIGDGGCDPSLGYVVDTSVAQQAVQCLRTGEGCDTYTPPNLYPDIGGVFDWTINNDAIANYSFATDLYPCVVSGTCST